MKGTDESFNRVDFILQSLATVTNYNINPCSRTWTKLKERVSHYMWQSVDMNGDVIVNKIGILPGSPQPKPTKR